MIRTFLTWLSLASAVVGSWPVAPAGAEEPSAPRSTAAAPPRRSGAEPRFAIYTGFGCSRSFRKVGEFPCLQSAHNALISPRDYFGSAWIVVPGRTHKAPGHLKPETSVARCSVYVMEGSRIRLYKEAATVAEADQLIQQLKPDAPGAFKVCYLK